MTLSSEEAAPAADDDALMARVAGGDQRAFAEIVRQHTGRLRALAIGFSGTTAEADDIVQDTFVSVWRRAGDWKPGGPPLGAYLTRIAVNRAIDGARRRSVRHFFGLEEADEIADTGALQDDRLASQGELAHVMADIRALPPRQRAAILLSAGGEQSNAEIAAALGQSVGAVEQLLVRARRRLKSKLAARGE